MNPKQKRVIKTQWKENCYIISSFPIRKDDEEFMVESFVSFLYDKGNIAVEWEPQYGPVQVWIKGSKETGKEHYFYDYVEDTPFNWSQMAVDSNRLKQAAYYGNFDHIFEVLKRFADRG